MVDKRKVKLSEASNATLDDLIHDIRIVWAEKDTQRTIYDTLLHTVNHASKLGEQVRRGEYKGVIDELGDTVMWFLTLVGKLQQPIKERSKTNPETFLFYTTLALTDIVWNKYPYVCPACFHRLSKENRKEKAWQRPCDCLLYSSIVEGRTDEEKAGTEKALLNFAEEHKNKKVERLADLEEMFASLYVANYENLSLESIAFHLLEEVGEVSDALIRLYSYNINKTPDPAQIYDIRRVHLESEIADVVSWIFAVSIKVKLLFQVYGKLVTKSGLVPFETTPTPLAEQINFANILWSRYGDKNTGLLYCPTCSQAQCKCELRFYNTEEAISSLLKGRI
jgi:NTP pyrophosphatase (non-canonical NTP hydrolase)